MIVLSGWQQGRIGKNHMMDRAKNPHRPQKGSIIRVDPIRSHVDVERIKVLLVLRLRLIGITNLRPCDLLRLTLGQVRDLKPGDLLVIREKKTAKVRTITVNHAVYAALQAYLETRAEDPDGAPLFASCKTGRALLVSTVNNLVKGWCKEAGLQGNYGAHTLRKTFGYLHRSPTEPISRPSWRCMVMRPRNKH